MPVNILRYVKIGFRLFKCYQTRLWHVKQLQWDSSNLIYTYDWLSGTSMAQLAILALVKVTWVGLSLLKGFPLTKGSPFFRRFLIRSSSGSIPIWLATWSIKYSIMLWPCCHLSLFEQEALPCTLFKQPCYNSYQVSLLWSAYKFVFTNLWIQGSISHYWSKIHSTNLQILSTVANTQ